jgi:hypothetical protein
MVNFNWPPGKNSITGLTIGPSDSNYKIRLLAEDLTKPGIFYTLNEIAQGSYPVQFISNLLSDGAGKGRYLSGDVFYLEAFNEKNEFIKGMKLDSKEKKPPHAIGATSVITQYIFEI